MGFVSTHNAPDFGAAASRSAGLIPRRSFHRLSDAYTKVKKEQKPLLLAKVLAEHGRDKTDIRAKPSGWTWTKDNSSLSNQEKIESCALELMQHFSRWKLDEELRKKNPSFKHDLILFLAAHYGSNISSGSLAQLSTVMGIDDLQAKHAKQLADLETQHGQALDKINLEHSETVDKLKRCVQSAIDEEENSLLHTEFIKSETAFVLVKCPCYSNCQQL